MAGDWIKFEVATSDKSEVWEIATALNIDPDAVVGKLLRVWAWFDTHTEDGVAPQQTKSMLDRMTGVAGFCDAVIQSGWLQIDAGLLVLPGFEKHNGKTAKLRMNTARRVANHKARKESAEGNAAANGAVTETSHERACIPRPIRRAVYERDSHACVYCQRKDGEYAPGETERDGILSVDHVIPVTRGGANTLENLVTCCTSCNNYKSDRTPEEAGLEWPVDAAGKRYGIVSASVSDALPKEDKREDIKNKKNKGLDFSAWLSTPSEQVLTDWFANRKAKKAPVNQTVINQFATQINLAHAAGRTADECLALCVVKGWQGFKFQWLLNEEASNANQIHATRVRPAGSAPGQGDKAERAARLAFGDDAGAPDVLDGDFYRVDEDAPADGLH